jgi:SAM-dependent methyltransferase
LNTTHTATYADEYFQYLQGRTALRKFLRNAYLRDIRKYCQGKTIDFGCGVGDLLLMLPSGSVGFEVNAVAVEYNKAKGRAVELYLPEKDDYSFTMVQPGHYQTFTMNHVLEHLTDPARVIRRIFEGCHRVGIVRVVFTVPGHKGYASDKTHRTFIDVTYLEKHGFTENEFYRLAVKKYFPLNSELFGRCFTHNELRLVFDARK